MVEYKLVKLLKDIQVKDVDGKPWKERDVVKNGKRDDGSDVYINVVTKEDEPAWTIRRWLELLVLNGKGWDAPIAKRRAASRVVDAVVAAEDAEKDAAKVRAEDWRAVKEHLEGDEFSIPPPHGRQLYCFEDAWLMASDCKLSSDKA